MEKSLEIMPISRCSTSRKSGTGSANGNYAKHTAGGCSSTKNTLGPAIYPRPAKEFARPSNQRSSRTLWTNSRPKIRKTPLTLILVTGRPQRRWMLCVVMTTGRILRPNLVLSRRLSRISPTARHGVLRMLRMLMAGSLVNTLRRYSMMGTR